MTRKKTQLRSATRCSPLSARIINQGGSVFFIGAQLFQRPEKDGSVRNTGSVKICFTAFVFYRLRNISACVISYLFWSFIWKGINGWAGRDILPGICGFWRRKYLFNTLFLFISYHISGRSFFTRGYSFLIRRAASSPSFISGWEN